MFLNLKVVDVDVNATFTQAIITFRPFRDNVHEDFVAAIDVWIANIDTTTMY